MKLSKFWRRARDAITGRFISLVEGSARPDTTVVERVKKRRGRRAKTRRSSSLLALVGIALALMLGAPSESKAVEACSYAAGSIDWSSVYCVRLATADPWIFGDSMRALDDDRRRHG